MSNEDFDKCVAAGGKVKHKTLGSGRYIQLCLINGNVYYGEVKKRERQKLKVFKQVMEQQYGGKNE